MAISTIYSTSEMKDLTISWHKKFFTLFKLWLSKSSSRKSLHNLPDWQLHDIGLSKDDALRESNKPFWH